MESLTLEELKEWKMAINSLIAQRITYSISVKEGSEREANNDKYLLMIFHILIQLNILSFVLVLESLE